MAGQDVCDGKNAGLEAGVTGSKKWLRHYKVAEKDENVVATFLAEEAWGKRKGTLSRCKKKTWI